MCAPTIKRVITCVYENRCGFKEMGAEKHPTSDSSILPCSAGIMGCSIQADNSKIIM